MISGSVARSAIRSSSFRRRSSQNSGVTRMGGPLFIPSSSIRSRSARSRGVSELRLVGRHALRPALIPIITVIGMQIAMLLGGAVLTETTFEWRGLGFMLAQYLSARDFVAVQGIVAMLAVIVAVTNFLVDIIAAFIDPRVRY